MIATARARSVSIIGITDHNSTANVRAALAQSEDEFLVLPGIEVTCADGDLLAYFEPAHVDVLEEFARGLDLLPQGDGSARSGKGIIQLVRDVESAGGIAIAAHIDTGDGLLARASATVKRDLLIQPGLVGLEFTRRDLIAAFTPEDPDEVGRQCWAERLKALGRRAPLARIMSSDAHTPNEVGREAPHRALTRLRIDHLNYGAVVAALRDHPQVRCLLEEPLPPSYPRVTRATYTGGFLDGVQLEFSPNLNCFIGSRGSGKTTALRALQLALGGAPLLNEDDQRNMPDSTEVAFLDALGSERIVVRERHGEPYDAASPEVPLSLRFHDLEQNVGREFLEEREDDPTDTCKFLDQFCDFAEVEGRIAEILAEIGSNAEILRRTAKARTELDKLRKENTQLEAGLAAASAAKLELVAKYAQILTREQELSEALRAVVGPLAEHSLPPVGDLDALAFDYGVDLTERPAHDVVAGDDGLRAEWQRLRARVAELESSLRAELKVAGERVVRVLDRWSEKHAEWERHVEERREELRKAGLVLQLGELDRLRRRLQELDRDTRKFTAWDKEYRAALAARKQLLADLRRERDRRHQIRTRVTTELADALQRQAQLLDVSVTWHRAGMRRPWGDWLGRVFGFRSPRSERVAEAITPAELADIAWRRATSELVAVNLNGDYFFQSDPEATMQELATFDVLFELETMDLEDRPEIRVRQADEPPGPGRLLRERSLGQIRAVVLGFYLASKGNAPLVLDQPEDHLDAVFLAETVVGYVHSAKERRQVIVATHNANLTVLGDAELVLPLEAGGGQSRLVDSGSVDSPSTQERVIRLLEGGRDAYRTRAERYGYRLQP
ncbi:MAG: AAA family ATPase [Candidatus Limnocylindria bacterium]